MNDYPAGNAAFFDSSTVSQLEELSDEDFWKYAHELAGITSSVLQYSEYLECELGSGSCLLPLAALDEVVLPPHRVTLLPFMPSWMRGILAWRGETIAVIDLDAYLSGSSDMLELSSEGTLLVTEVGEEPVGLLVPKVGATTSISPEQLTIPSQAFAWYMPGRGKAIQGVYAEALVLDLAVLLADVVQQIGMASSDG